MFVMTLKEYAGHDQGLHVEYFKDKLQGKLGLSLNLSCHLKGCDNWFTPEFQQQHTAALYIVFKCMQLLFWFLILLWLLWVCIM